MINLHSDNKEEDNDDLDDLDVLGFQLQGTLLLLLVRGARKVPLENNLEMFKIFIDIYRDRYYLKASCQIMISLNILKISQ